MYVLPGDGADQRFDTDGTISGSMRLAQNWFASQTNNRRVRYDTYQSALDITFLRLARTDAQFLSFGSAIRGAIQADLEAAGFNDPQKIYAVFYGGGSPRSGVQIPCGQGGSPGTMGAIYLACLLDRSDIQSLIPGGTTTTSTPIRVASTSPGVPFSSRARSRSEDLVLSSPPPNVGWARIRLEEPVR